MNLAQILRRRRDEDERGYCACCKSWVIPITVDDGIGFYEAWGATGVHHDYRSACPDCESDLLDREPETEDETEEE